MDHTKSESRATKKMTLEVNDALLSVLLDYMKQKVEDKNHDLHNKPRYVTGAIATGTAAALSHILSTFAVANSLEDRSNEIQMLVKDILKSLYCELPTTRN